MPPIPRRLAVPGLLLALLAPLATAHAQSADRIWGTVHTHDGQRHEGFLRFGGGMNAASWADPFTTVQHVGDAARRAWLDASRGTDAILRTVELEGYRITWNDRSEDFLRERRISIGFGALQEIVLRHDTVAVVLRPEQRPRLPVRRADSPWEETWIAVGDARRGVVTLESDEVRRIEFAAPPTGNEAGSTRLLGTVVDESGRRFTGPVTWNESGVLDSDTLNGRFAPSSAGAIVLGDVRSVQRLPGEAGESGGIIARVTLVSGDVVDLSPPRRGRDPVEEILVIDPGLGRVTVEWDEFEALHLHRDRRPSDDPPRNPPPGDVPTSAIAGYDAFDGGTPLRGAVTTEDGEEVAGRIRWNALKEWSWDVLPGSSDGVGMAVRFANIARIEKLAFPDDSQARRTMRRLFGRALVTLRDGRAIEMTGSGDLGTGNLGILVLPDSSAGESKWRHIAWEDVGEIRFEDAGEASRP